MEIFQLIEGLPVPQLPWDDSGKPIQADGVNYFTVEQAAQRFGKTLTWLKNIYRATFRPILGDGDELFGQQPDPAAQDKPPTDDRPDLRQQARLRLLQRKHPKLMIEQLELFVAECEQRGLNAFCNDLVPRVETGDDGALDVKIITTVAALRKIAMRSGCYGGEDPEEFCGLDGAFTSTWMSVEPPKMARGTIYRVELVKPIIAIVEWSERAQYVPDKDGNPMLDEFWQEKPRTMLGKCAMAAALRKAFPDELSGLYTFEEMGKSNRRPAGRLRRLGQDDSSQATSRDSMDPSMSIEDAESENITSVGQWELALHDMGLRDPAARRRAMAVLRTDFRRYGFETPAFFGISLRAVKDNPNRYGMTG